MAKATGGGARGGGGGGGMAAKKGGGGGGGIGLMDKWQMGPTEVGYSIGGKPIGRFDSNSMKVHLYQGGGKVTSSGVTGCPPARA